MGSDCSTHGEGEKCIQNFKGEVDVDGGKKVMVKLSL
jgi:hypothetical protein